MSGSVTDAAMTQLVAQIDDYNGTQVRKVLDAIVPQLLDVAPQCVAIVIDNDTIGIAAMSKSGRPGATQGAKADAVANVKQWAADRCNEITRQWALASAE